ncbi:hypothetical protein ACFWP2_28845 [Kitasatospora sp. NPDC058444]|uniref:hypothetical protein n=1 Tax=Kitasatospora sp. NPDC058444 TaxID=3346504 RepID=UPI003652B772
MGPDPTPADGTETTPVRRRTRPLSSSTASHDVVGLDTIGAQAAIGASLAEVAMPIHRMIADISKSQSVLDQHGIATASLKSTLDSVSRMMAGQLKLSGINTAVESLGRGAAEQVRLSGLSGTLDSVSRMMAGQLKASGLNTTLESLGRGAAEQVRLFGLSGTAESFGRADARPVLVDLAKSAVLGYPAASVRNAFADAARMAAGPQNSYWLSIQAQKAILQVEADRTLPLTATLAQLTEIGQLHADLTGALSRVRIPDAPDLSARPVGHWRNYIADLPPLPTPGHIENVLVSGQTSLGIVAAEVAISADPDERDDAAFDVEQQILAPWQQARQDVVDELYAHLREFDPTVPGLLDGAWDDIARQGPGAVDKAASCIVEALDRTLRKAAPNDVLKAWFPTSGLDRKLWPDPDKQPPHALRIRYIAGPSKEEAKVAIGMVESILVMNTHIRGRVQSIKHTGQGDINSVRALLMSAEHVLRMLFLM